MFRPVDGWHGGFQLRQTLAVEYWQRTGVEGLGVCVCWNQYREELVRH
jgi:hypothetical protein